MLSHTFGKIGQNRDKQFDDWVNNDENRTGTDFGIDEISFPAYLGRNITGNLKDPASGTPIFSSYYGVDNKLSYRRVNKDAEIYRKKHLKLVSHIKQQASAAVQYGDNFVMTKMSKNSLECLTRLFIKPEDTINQSSESSRRINHLTNAVNFVYNFSAQQFDAAREIAIQLGFYSATPSIIAHMPGGIDRDLSLLKLGILIMHDGLLFNTGDVDENIEQPNVATVLEDGTLKLKKTSQIDKRTGFQSDGQNLTKDQTRPHNSVYKAADGSVQDEYDRSRTMAREASSGTRFTQREYQAKYD